MLRVRSFTAVGRMFKRYSLRRLHDDAYLSSDMDWNNAEGFVWPDPAKIAVLAIVMAGTMNTAIFSDGSIR